MLKSARIMKISHLSLTNFRNFGRLELKLKNGVTLLHGDNAQGKTNFLEAIYYLATTRSPHTNQDSQLINWDADQYGGLVLVGRIVAHVETNDGLRHLEVRLIRERNSFRREALVDRRKVRLMDLLGNVRVVLFLPEDMNLVTGPPSDRRRYLNITLCQVDRVYCRTLSQYNKVLEQRNALLRQLNEQGKRQPNNEVLSIFSEQLVTLGSQIFARRALFLTELARQVQRVHYESLTAGQETLRLTYLPRLLRVSADQGRNQLKAEAKWLAAHATDLEAVEARFRDHLNNVHAHDLARGATSLGPHRDDWRFTINGRSLNHYGSRGQQRSAVLALKMGEIQWISAETGDTPLLLLDDVMAELDAHRRALLLKALDTINQTIMTSADPSIFESAFTRTAATYAVSKGHVVRSDLSAENVQE